MKKISLLFSLASLLLVCFTACTPADTAVSQKTAKASINSSSPTTKTTAPVHHGLHVGDTAPDFKLKNIDGSMFALADIKDAKGYIIVFTCNHCPYAVMYEDRMIDLHNTYAPLGYPIVAINPNDPELYPSDNFEAMKIRAKEKAFPFVYLFDDGQKVYPQYGATKTPHVFLLNKERAVTYIGAIDDNHEDASAVKVKYLENAIAAMEKGVAADPSSTKAVGCSIKTSKKKH